MWIYKRSVMNDDHLYPETLNIPGTNTSRHNALRIRRLSEADLKRAEEVCLNAAKKCLLDG